MAMKIVKTGIIMLVIGQVKYSLMKAIKALGPSLDSVLI
tara:strand:- start:2588 stop:2704 length:117 start_codon:yes stop_codon:yes gene_type:complete